MNSAAILIIDDEVQIRKLLRITLQTNGYKVDEAVSSREGLIMAVNHPPDAIILDLGLPDEDGQETLKKLREWYNKPVIILSVKNNEEDIVSALDHGANDYLVKPFRTAELLARIRTAMRSSISAELVSVIEGGGLSIDLTSRTVKKNGVVVKLTSTEYSLLSLLARNEGKVLTHQHLLQEVWGPGYIQQSQYLRVFIAQLRKKTEDDPNRPAFILTESGVGYRFVLPE